MRRWLTSGGAARSLGAAPRSRPSTLGATRYGRSSTPSDRRLHDHEEDDGHQQEKPASDAATLDLPTSAPAPAADRSPRGGGGGAEISMTRSTTCAGRRTNSRRRSGTGRSRAASHQYARSNGLISRTAMIARPVIGSGEADGDRRASTRSCARPASRSSRVVVPRHPAAPMNEKANVGPKATIAPSTCRNSSQGNNQARSIEPSITFAAGRPAVPARIAPTRPSWCAG